MQDANSQIQIFNFNSNTVRIQIINNKEYFCAKDVTDALGYSNGRDAIEKHCKTKGVAKHDTLTNGGIQKLTFIDEANVLRLIVNSKLPSAEKFEAWVFEEILPTIRKTGKYEVQEAPQIDSKFLLQIAEKMAEKERLIELQSKQITVLEIENTQKEDVIEKFIEAKEHKNYTETAGIIGMPQKKFFEYLRSNGYIEKDGRRPTAKSKTLKIIETKWSESGYERFLVTPKGIEYFKRKISLAL